jgi:hypothetical protein
LPSASTLRNIFLPPRSSRIVLVLKLIMNGMKGEGREKGGRKEKAEERR